ncbi:hypothetical protein E6C27_scaffold264G00660 [Cucumis melo var. makuwa]|uniref:Uncharacterized protein n=1 Tax=Cucumis melo var. makuwa TaxID=1194695 RepID=A0A5A7TYX6_CUCMM|nr:hypothetical protein E6C27_scaffold264G00660 [Cucumis melo var. makuwa]
MEVRVMGKKKKKKKKCQKSSPERFELSRGNPMYLAGTRLNHSAKATLLLKVACDPRPLPPPTSDAAAAAFRSAIPRPFLCNPRQLHEASRISRRRRPSNPLRPTSVQISDPSRQLQVVVEQPEYPHHPLSSSGSNPITCLCFMFAFRVWLLSTDVPSSTL